MQTCQPGLGLIANQIILFIFALMIYDEFDANAMVTDRIITTRSFRQLRLCLIIIVILARLKSTHTLKTSLCEIDVWRLNPLLL